MELIDSIEGKKYRCDYYHDNEINASYLFQFDINTDIEVDQFRDSEAETIYDLLLKHGIDETKIDDIVSNHKQYLNIPSDDEIEEMIKEHEEEQLREKEKYQTEIEQKNHKSFNIDKIDSTEDMPF